MSKNHPISRPFDSLEIPDFAEYIRDPKNPVCRIIDNTRLIVEILGGIGSDSGEYHESSYSQKLMRDGDFSIVLRYRREVSNECRPVCVLSFDVRNDGIHITQIQGSRDKHVAFRVHASFNIIAFFLKMVEESFIKKGIPVTVERFPNGIENASYASQSRERHVVFRTAVEGLIIKYAKKIKGKL